MQVLLTVSAVFVTQLKIEFGILQPSPVFASQTTTLMLTALVYFVQEEATLAHQPTPNAIAILLRTLNGETLPLPASARILSTLKTPQPV